MKNKSPTATKNWLPPCTSFEGKKRQPTTADFKMDSDLGKGSYGLVKKIASIATGKEYAIKCIFKKPTENPEPVDELMNEFNIMRKISHKNIIKLEGYFEDDTFIFFVLELAEKENLYDRLKKVKNFEHQEPEAAKYMFQVLQAVNYLHSQEPPIIQEASSPKISF